MDFELLCVIIKNVLPEAKEIYPDDHLASDIGLCSFEMMVIIAQIEQITEHPINVSCIHKNMTVTELLKLIN